MRLNFLPCIFLLVAYSQAQSPNNYNLQGWIKGSKYLREYMDETAKPCEDFAGLMCRNFGNTSDNSNFYSWEAERLNVMKAAMNEAIDAINLNDSSTPEYARNVKNFYSKCITNKIDTSAVKELYALLKAELGQYPPFEQATDTTKGSQSVSDLWFLVGKLRRDFGKNMGLAPGISVVTDKDGIRSGYIEFKPLVPAAGFANTAYLRNRTMHVARILNISLDEERLDDILNETAAFYKDWRSLRAPRTSDDDDNSDAIDTTTKNVANQFSSNITWESYFRGLLTDEALEKWYNDDGEVVIRDPGAMRAMANVFSRHTMRAIKTAMYAILMQTLLEDYTERSLSEMHWSGIGASKKDLCMEFVIQRMSPSAARVYFDNLGENIMDWRNEILLIGKNVFSAMRILLNSVDYLSPASKERINKKIDAIHFSPGIPSWILDDKKVLASSGQYNNSQSLAMNTIRRNREMFLEELQKLVQPDIEVDERPTFSANDFFIPFSNDPHILIYLGDNLPPQFSLNQPMALKYGGLGFSIGHELMHAFDSDGIIAGALDNETILEADELEMYDKHKQCLIQQYSSTCYKKLGGCLVGVRALRDNIADTGGLKAAYAAYKFVTGVNGEEPPLPFMAQYTGDQLFYMTFQRYYCARNDPVGLLASDHTPNDARAPIALKNNPHFAEVFGCAVGSKAAPVKQCKMWGDILSPAI